MGPTVTSGPAAAAARACHPKSPFTPDEPLRRDSAAVNPYTSIPAATACLHPGSGLSPTTTHFSGATPIRSAAYRTDRAPASRTSCEAGHEPVPRTLVGPGLLGARPESAHDSRTTPRSTAPRRRSAFSQHLHDTGDRLQLPLESGEDPPVKTPRRSPREAAARSAPGRDRVRGAWRRPCVIPRGLLRTRSGARSSVR